MIVTAITAWINSMMPKKRMFERDTDVPTKDSNNGKIGVIATGSLPSNKKCIIMVLYNANVQLQ